jgi:hypothetical protein
VICHSWCERLHFRRIGNAIAIQIPITLPDEHCLHCYLEEEEDGSITFSDWHELLGSLFIYGIHKSPLINIYAKSIGFDIDAQGEIRKEGIHFEDIPELVNGYFQLASIAVAELQSIEFHPAPLSIPSTWIELLTREVHRPGVSILMSGRHIKVDQPGLIRQAAVAVKGVEPIVVSPVLSTAEAGYRRMTQLLVDAEPSIMGIVPLIHSKNIEQFHRQDELFKDALSRVSRNFEMQSVPLYLGEECFDPQKKIYPAIGRLNDGVPVFLKVLDTVLMAG